MKVLLALSAVILAGCASSSDSGGSPQAYGSVFGGYGPFYDHDWDHGHHRSSGGGGEGADRDRPGPGLGPKGGSASDAFGRGGKGRD